NTEVREGQIIKLRNLKAQRDNDAVKKQLDELTLAAQTGKGNLLALSIKAAKARATLGEISDALEKVYGRYSATIKSIGGVYSKEIAMDKYFIQAKEQSDEFALLEGRRPRIMVAKIGQDGHDRGAKVI